MALFELNIYGNDDEVIKRFETNKVRWGVYLQATELAENLEGEKTAEKFRKISAFLKKIFPDLTDEELEKADSDDVLNTFTQLIRKANGIKAKSDESKNG